MYSLDLVKTNKTVTLFYKFMVGGLTQSLFSPLGKFAGRVIYLACVNFFFFILFFFYYEQSYLSIYWTNFHDLFTKWKVFA